MKNCSEISMFLLIICVFGADGYGDRVKIVSVMEGDSVTLDTHIRDKFNHIQWRFGDSYSIIAETDGYEASYTKVKRFRDRLKLNNQTGSLTINNMRITDSGVYRLYIDHNTGTLYKIFNVTVHVFGADEDEVKRETVMEGDSVTLGPRLTEEFNHILWRFGDSYSIIAETDRNKISYTDDERFRGRLKLNHQTGSLTINNMRITDSGLYRLWIDHNDGIFNQIFNVTVRGSSISSISPGAVAGIVVVVLLVLSAASVSAVLCYRCKICKRRKQNGVFEEDEVKIVSVMEGDSVTLDARLREEFNQIKWRFGGSESIIAESNRYEISYTDERFRDGLKLNHQTGSLTINNTRDTDSGVYELRIDNFGFAIVTFSVTVNGSSVSDPDLSPVEVAGIVVVVLLLVFAVAAAVSAGIIHQHIISNQEMQNERLNPLKTDEEDLELDHQTGSLRTTDSGDSDLQIELCSEDTDNFIITFQVL